MKKHDMHVEIKKHDRHVEINKNTTSEKSVFMCINIVFIDRHTQIDKFTPPVHIA